MNPYIQYIFIRFEGVSWAWGWGLLNQFVMIRYGMKTLSALLDHSKSNSGISLASNVSFDVFFDINLNKRLNKHSSCQWFDTPWCPLWCHCHVPLFFWLSWTPKTCHLLNIRVKVWFVRLLNQFLSLFPDSFGWISGSYLIDVVTVWSDDTCQRGIWFEGTLVNIENFLNGWINVQKLMYPRPSNGESFWRDISSTIYILSGSTFQSRSSIIRCPSSHCPWSDYYRMDGENAGRGPLIRPSDCRERRLLRLRRLRFLWYTTLRRAGETSNPNMNKWLHPL